MDSPTTKYKSTYRTSADLAPWMGAYLTLMSAALIGGLRLPALTLLLFPLALGLPVVLYLLLQRIWTAQPHLRTFSALWLCGIWLFIFGALLCGALTAAWLLLFDPSFVSDYITVTLQTIEDSPLRDQYLSEIQMMHAIRDAGATPSPMQFIFTMMWSTAFFGSLLSLAVSLMVMARGRRRTLLS